jgi:hypothetical protein
MPLDIFWSLRTADLAAARAIHRLTATNSPESGLLPIAVIIPKAYFRYKL